MRYTLHKIEYVKFGSVIKRKCTVYNEYVTFCPKNKSDVQFVLIKEHSTKFAYSGTDPKEQVEIEYQLNNIIEKEADPQDDDTKLKTVSGSREIWTDYISQGYKTIE